MGGVWQRTARAADLAERRIDRTRAVLRRRMGRVGPLTIEPYVGYGTTTELRLRCRVLERAGAQSPLPGDSAWLNLRRSVRRFLSAEVPGVRVHAVLRGPPRPTGRWRAPEPGAAPTGPVMGEATVVTDIEGYGEIVLWPNAPLPDGADWWQVELRLLDRIDERPAVVTGHVMVPRRARLAVITDLDDTVIRSEATSFGRMLRLAFLRNEHTRLPMPGAPELYRALREGPDGVAGTPIFYVSSSPWNLYPMLTGFLGVHDVPCGPVLLRDWTPSTVRSGSVPHKLASVRALLRAYPELPFLLIGDSGERDPEIYQKLALEHPGRVRAVYIRDVATTARREEVLAIGTRLRAVGVDVVVARDSAVFTEHARRTGLVAPHGG